MPAKNNFSAEKKSQLKKNILAELAKGVVAPAVKSVKPVKSVAPAKPINKMPKKALTPAPVAKPLSAVKAKPLIKPFKIKTDQTQSLKGILLLAIFLAFLIVAVDLIGIYRLGFQDDFSLLITRVLPLPAGKINNHYLRLADYLSDAKILRRAMTNDREGVENILTASQDMETRVFERLAAIRLVREELKKSGRTLEAKQLNAQYDEIIKQLGGKIKASEALSDLYGLNLKDFKEKILRPLLEREILQEIAAQNESLALNQAAKEKAEQVLQLALAPSVDFATLAGQYTEDEAGIKTGGEMGWISRGEVDEALEKVLFATTRGEVYGEIVKNRLGYHIIKVEEKLVNSDDGQESVNARQILIRVDVDEYIKGLFDQAVIKKFVR